MTKKKKTNTQFHKSVSSNQIKTSQDISIWLIAISILFTFISYLPVINAGFVNWDDNSYVVNNSSIHSLSNYKSILTDPVEGNYHPLTMFSLALNYSFGGEDASSYHLINLFLHLLNVFLVYKLASLLSKNNNLISFATALLFGIHPMHVESVAWVSERKDVLYTFFFLLAIISYLKYVDTKSGTAYIFSILWFLLSLASKPAAIIFPVALFAFDFFRGRKITWKLFTEKIPYFVLSILLAWLTFHSQQSVGATDLKEAISLDRRMFFPFYGYMTYFIKMLLPINLSAFYPFLAINESMPIEYYVAPFFFIATGVLCYITRKKYPVITFGFSFYLINLILILQFFIVGSAIIADRYTYVPYISLFFLFGWFINKWFAQKKIIAYSILGTVGLILSVATYGQARTWKNSAALWDNVIANAPSGRAYINRARLFRQDGNLDKALENYNEAIKLNKADPEAFCNRGNIYSDKKIDSLALADYNSALKLNSNYVAALDNRGALFAREGKYDEALTDLSKALELDSTYKTAIKNQAMLYLVLTQYENAIHDFEKYLTLNPNDADSYNSIAVCQQNLSDYEASIKSFNSAIKLSENAQYYLNRSYSWNKLAKLDEARNDAQKAQKLGMKVPENYLKLIGL